MFCRVKVSAGSHIPIHEGAEFTQTTIPQTIEEFQQIAGDEKQKIHP